MAFSNPPYHKVVSVNYTADKMIVTTKADGTVPFIATDCNSILNGGENGQELDLVVQVKSVGSDHQSGTLITQQVKNYSWVQAGSDSTEHTFEIPLSLLCANTSYTLLTYAFNTETPPPDNNGLVQGWKCCSAFTPDPNLAGMEVCTLITNGGSGTGWFNPSYRQLFLTTTPDFDLLLEIPFRISVVGCNEYHYFIWTIDDNNDPCNNRTLRDQEGNVIMTIINGIVQTL